MPLFSKFPIDKKAIESAIECLERNSSAELRVYIERTIPNTVQTDDKTKGYNRAFDIFYRLEMDQTEQANAVLIYLAYKDHYCQVIGDKGIHQYVGEAFWREICDAMIVDFKQQRYTQGIVKAIERISEQLAIHFPSRPNDKNELTNEVIIHE